MVDYVGDRKSGQRREPTGMRGKKGDVESEWFVGEDGCRRLLSSTGVLCPRRVCFVSRVGAVVRQNAHESAQDPDPVNRRRVGSNEGCRRWLLPSAPTRVRRRKKWAGSRSKRGGKMEERG